jgi:hypothetical protein
VTPGRAPPVWSDGREAMQHGSQDAVGDGLVGKITIVAELLESFLCLLEGMADGRWYRHG